MAEGGAAAGAGSGVPPAGPSPEDVSLVIPGKNAARTLAACLASAARLLAAGRLLEVIFVDDGSSDETADIARRFPVRLLQTAGGGPGHARNVGWRAARGSLVWFVDADCELADDSLALLLPHLEDPGVAGVGGSYANPYPDRLLPTVIHEEIRQRHLAAPAEVDYLGSFNVLYRRPVLAAAGGFDEHRFNGPGKPGAEDADLSYRIVDLGHRLRIEPASQVVHHHPTRLAPYLRAQRLHGFWGVRLYLRHPRRSGGNSYSDAVDHLQPPLALLTVLALPGLLARRGRALVVVLAAALVAAHLPMAARMVARTGDRRLWAMVPLAVARTLARAAGMVRALVALVLPRLRPPGR